jgi:hypothetical protein
MVEGSESTPAAGSHRRKQLIVVGLAVLVVALAIGAIVALTSGDDDKPSAASQTVPSTSTGSDGSGPGAGAQGARTTTTLTPEQRREAALKARAAERAKRSATASTTRGGSGAPGGKTTTPTTATSTSDTVSPTVEKAYVDAYNATCAEIWRIAGADGQLIDISSGDDEDAGQAFLVTDCQGLRDPLDIFFYDTVPDATAGGRSDAFWNLNNAMVGNVLRNTAGTQTYRVPAG